MRFLIAYDISSDGRRTQVATLLVRHAVRIQQSVYTLTATAREMNALLDEVAQIISPEYDVVQAFRLATDQPADGMWRGMVTPADPACVVTQRGRCSFVRDDS